MTKAEMQASFDERVETRVREILAERGRKAGKAGGPARAAALSPRKRSMIARKAAKARWAKKNGEAA